jgi:5'-methylthioadenosine phosphorylase
VADLGTSIPGPDVAEEWCIVIGVFGGSGFYALLDDAKRVEVDTPYGKPSAPYTVGQVGDIDVAFLPRHGENHQYPAHKVPFRANAWGMKELGVDRVIGPCAAGSLAPEFGPGSFVVSDQLVDRTHSRDGTFFDGPNTVHLSFADPYCAELRPLAVEAAAAAGAIVHDGGTVVVIQGPRFSTRAESDYYARQGWGVINMTQAPEAQLSRELEMCYVSIAVITDYDVGVAGDVPAVTHAEVLRQFEVSLDTLRRTVLNLIPQAATTARACVCASALEGAS